MAASRALRIGFLAHLQTANGAGEAKCLGAVDGCELERALRRHDRRVLMQGFVDYGGEMHHGQVAGVVAGCTVNA